MQGRIQDFKIGGGGAHLKKSRRAKGGANIFGVFRMKNHDFTPKNLIFSNCGGRHENLLGISCEKSRFYTKKNKKNSNFRGGGGFAPLPPWIRPCNGPLPIIVIAFVPIKYCLLSIVYLVDSLLKNCLI